MNEKIDSTVSVSFVFDHKTNKIFPRWVVWKDRLYPVSKLGLHHTFRKGRTLYHVFSVVSKTLFFRLVLNTDNLRWTLTEIADDLPN